MLGYTVYEIFLTRLLRKRRGGSGSRSVECPRGPQNLPLLPLGVRVEGARGAEAAAGPGAAQPGRGVGADPGALPGGDPL